MRLRTERAILAAIAVAYLTLFARTVGYDWVWDDVHEIAQNPMYDGPLVAGLGATQMAKNDPSLVELRDIQLDYDSYRPLLFVSYWTDVHLWGKRPGPLHATNVLIGLLAIGVAYALARRWFAAPIALVPTAIFALHPLQVEAVAYISGRADLLSGLFALVATLLALAAIDRDRPAPIRTALAALAFAASLACKESCVALPLVVALLALLRGRLRARWWVAAAMLVAGVAYLAVRATIVAGTAGHALGGAVRALPDLWLAYVRTSLVPIALSSEHPLRVVFGIAGWAIAAAVGALVGFGVVRRREATAPIALGLAWMVLLVGPAAVAVQMTGVIADRYMYAPLFGFAILATGAGRAFAHAYPRAVVGMWGIVGAWGLVLVGLAWRQVPTWESNRALYTHAAETEPASSEAQYRRAYLDVLANDWQAALPRLELAVQLDGHNTRALNNLGVGFLRIGAFADAEAALTRAVAQNPAYFRSWLNLGVARISLGRRAEGCAAIARALQINPAYEAGRREDARSCRP